MGNRNIKFVYDDSCGLLPIKTDRDFIFIVCFSLDKSEEGPLHCGQIEAEGYVQVISFYLPNPEIARRPPPQDLDLSECFHLFFGGGN
jgi:hypothetical protein